MAKRAKGKKEKQKPVPVKTSLNSPYALKWTPLQKGHGPFILKTVKEKIETLGFKKRHVNVPKWKKRDPSKQPVSPPGGAVESQQLGRVDATTQPRSWTHTDVRRQLAIGINEVTKGLERNELSLLLVCSSVKPPHMTSHLVPLSRTRSVPACQVPGLSESISQALGLDSVLALGFKRGGETFADTVDAVVPKVPPLDVAWLPAERKRAAGKARAEELQSPLSPPEGPEERPEDAQPAKGRKRKLDHTEAAEGPDVSLQPLKVKKTIPNPSENRREIKLSKSDR
ncbi:ribonuclease P protein subunit p38 [Brachyhypopomus gauderio]|uniref:ribonuclease P protein subunit p38 n=1 Tax=Brachyhypopomus gauderio TaxID=698409 RepID=UPI004041066B